MTTWLVLLTIGLPWLGALVVWATGDTRPKMQHGLAVIFSAAAGLISLALLPFTADAVVLRVPMGSAFGEFTLVADGLGVFLSIVATVIGCLTVVFSIDYMHGEGQLGRYYALVLLFIGAMAGLVLSGSLLFMFLFWEITAFCSYALISFHNDDPKAVAGGIKALIVTQIGGVGLLAGALVAYATLGSYQIETFLAGAQAMPSAVLSAVGFGFLIAAAAKSAQVPFQTWLPDAMEAPTPISALIHAATMVNAGVYLLARFYPAFEAVPGWTTAVVTVGLLSALLAALMALVANDLKRVLAYSTISQLGYMVYAIGTGAVFASQFHLLSHSVFKALLFLGAGAVIHTVGTRDMRAMGGLGRQMPIVRLVFVIGALALVGLPISNGFFSKELVLEGGLAGGPLWAYIGMLIGVGLTALYTTRMVWMVFYGEARGEAHAHDAALAMRIPLTLLALGTLTTWLAAGPFGSMLAGSLPYHHLHVASTVETITEVIGAPATWLALAVVALGIGTWAARRALVGLAKAAEPLADFAGSGLGFEWLNGKITGLVQGAASLLQITQTGYLNLNMVGIVGGLIVILVILTWGSL
jgi:NADH-quinone oxidoreductase subunit L